MGGGGEGGGGHVEAAAGGQPATGERGGAGGEWFGKAVGSDPIALVRQCMMRCHSGQHIIDALNIYIYLCLDTHTHKNIKIGRNE